MPRRLRPYRVPLDGRPLSHIEQSAARADRLALLLAGAVIKNSVFSPPHAAIPLDCFDDAPDWLARQVRPLAAHSRVARDLCHILAGTTWTTWDDARRLRRIVQHLQRDIARLQPTQILRRHG